jgi:cytochrome P450
LLESHWKNRKPAMTRLTVTTSRTTLPREVPGPAGVPLLGSALDLRRDQLATFEEGRRRYGDIVRFVAGLPGLRVVAYGVFCPEGAQQVLTGTGRRYTKGNLFYRETAAMLGDGILTSESDRWQRQKRFVQPLFTRHRVAGYVDVMAEETAALVDRWHAAARQGGSVDAAEDMMRLTLGVIGRVLFGDDLDRAVPVLHDAFPVVSAHVVRRLQSPLRLPATWPTPANRRAARAQRRLYDVVDGIIDRRRAAGTADEDLLSLLLRARDPDAAGADALDDAEVRDQVLIFLLAGHETTATALTFTLHLLGGHPEVQQRVRVETERVLGADDQAPTIERIAALSYTTQVIKEAMRLYPSAYAIGRRAVEGDMIDGYRIPPGADVVRQPLGHPPSPARVGAAAALRSRPLHSRAGTAAPPLRLDAVRRRSQSLHRPVLLHARGDLGHCERRPCLRSTRPAWASAADHRHHPAARRMRALTLTPRPPQRRFRQPA